MMQKRFKTPLFFWSNLVTKVSIFDFCYTLFTKLFNHSATIQRITCYIYIRQVIFFGS